MHTRLERLTQNCVGALATPEASHIDYEYTVLARVCILLLLLLASILTAHKPLHPNKSGQHLKTISLRFRGVELAADRV